MPSCHSNMLLVDICLHAVAALHQSVVYNVVRVPVVLNRYLWMAHIDWKQAVTAMSHLLRPPRWWLLITGRHMTWHIHMTADEMTTTSMVHSILLLPFILGSGIDSVSLLILLCFLLGWSSSKGAQVSFISNWMGMKFTRIILQLNTYRLTRVRFLILHDTFKMVAMMSASCLLLHM